MLLIFIMLLKNRPTVIPESISEDAKDCGSENITRGIGKNQSIRECFYQSYQACEQAKIYQENMGIDAGPRKATIVIEGKDDKGCRVRIYVDETDRTRLISHRKYSMSCYNIIYDSSGVGSLEFNQCSNDMRFYTY